VMERGLMTRDELDRALNPDRMAGPAAAAPAR
jgi:hypothetical protein